MKLYRAYILDRNNRANVIIIESEYTSKRAFMRDLRANGYYVARGYYVNMKCIEEVIPSTAPDAPEQPQQPQQPTVTTNQPRQQPAQPFEEVSTMQPFNYDESMEVYRSASYRIDISGDYYFILPVGGFRPLASFRLLSDAVVYADMLAGKTTDNREYSYQYDVVCSNIAKYTEYDETRGARDLEIWSATDNRVILSVWSNDRLTLQRVIHDNASEYYPFIENVVKQFKPY